MNGSKMLIYENIRKSFYSHRGDKIVKVIKK